MTRETFYKFGQLIKYKWRNIFFFRNNAVNEIGRLVPKLLFFKKKKKDLYKIKVSGQKLSFNVFW